MSKVQVNEEFLKAALRVGHGNWKAEYEGWNEIYHIRLEKLALNSSQYRLIFSTETGQAWDVAVGHNAEEMFKMLKEYFPNELVLY